jgi:uncharacterized phage infection (PIP) family protein YhgE
VSVYNTYVFDTLDRSGGEDITSPRKETHKGTRKKGKHNHTKMWVERLENAMRNLADNHTSISHRFETLVEFSTKVMNFVATTLYFLQTNKEENDLGKTTDTTHSIYGFLEKD